MSVKALKALELYDIWTSMPTDRGGREGPKGKAFAAFETMKHEALAEDFVERANRVKTLDRQRRVEELAQVIYARWSDQPGYVPWVEGGNSVKQREARRLASFEVQEETT